MMSGREIYDSGLLGVFFLGGGLKSKCDSAENIEYLVFNSERQTEGRTGEQVLNNHRGLRK